MSEDVCGVVVDASDQPLYNAMSGWAEEMDASTLIPVWDLTCAGLDLTLLSFPSIIPSFTCHSFQATRIDVAAELTFQ